MENQYFLLIACPSLSLFRHMFQLAVLESNQGELNGQKKIYINSSVCFYPAYFLLNAEVGNWRERRRKWQEVEGKGKMSVGKILNMQTNKTKQNCKRKSKRSSFNNRTQRILFLAPGAYMLSIKRDVNNM